MSLKFVKKCIALNEDDIKLRDEETKIKKKRNVEKISEIGLEKALQSSRRTLIELSAGANVRCVPLGALVLTSDGFSKVRHPRDLKKKQQPVFVALKPSMKRMKYLSNDQWLVFPLLPTCFFIVVVVVVIY